MTCNSNYQLELPHSGYFTIPNSTFTILPRRPREPVVLDFQSCIFKSPPQAAQLPHSGYFTIPNSSRRRRASGFIKINLMINII